MAGRNLRRNRLQAIDRLTDEDASDLAYAVVNQVSPHEAVQLYAATRRKGEPLALGPDADRVAVALAIASDPESARRVIAIHAYLPAVELALGITRTAGQQLR